MEENWYAVTTASPRPGGLPGRRPCGGSSLHDTEAGTRPGLLSFVLALGSWLGG